MQRSGELIVKTFDDDLQISDAETSIELNFAVLKFKHTVKKKRVECTFDANKIVAGGDERNASYLQHSLSHHD